MFKVILTSLSLIFVYLVTALLAWDLDPGNWGWFLRLWAIAWAVPWGVIGFVWGIAVDDDRRVDRAIKNRPPASGNVIDI